MPLYEYYCSDCRSKFELLVSHKHADDVVCTKCHSENVRRMLSLFAARAGNSEGDFDDYAPSMGSCACGDGGCGCH
ncbi:putative FmdB family regulatory protein [Thermosporothrix hazakensis]|jgi:putative FmdB family regulatory protein|uniref:Putative FmdB family regulatory protein n=1 Tax=Thermosporothrix hazakensis TaxID=644383 RepID=A0A326U755_THEHA|nr:zinc ribbon domain-containing protein [Thermosporothrix hazakensis]PZW26593.1 putative FmdB family regulatory protein [Thermosporothrix hazakensis]